MAYGYSDSLQIKGLIEVQQRLATFGEKVANVVTQKALNEGANLIKDEAKILAPEWEGKVYKNGTIVLYHYLKVKGVPTKIWAGNLRQQIKARNIRKVEKGIKKAQVYVKLKQAWYAKFVEGLENGSSRQPAKPFMRPAFENKKDEVPKLFEIYVKEAIGRGGL